MITAANVHKGGRLILLLQPISLKPACIHRRDRNMLHTITRRSLDKRAWWIDQASGPSFVGLRGMRRLLDIILASAYILQFEQTSEAPKASLGADTRTPPPPLQRAVPVQSTVAR